MDLVLVVGEGEGVGLAFVGDGADDLVGFEGALEGEEAADCLVGDRAFALVALDGDVVDFGELERGAVLGVFGSSADQA